MTNCINPAEIREGDLLAFAEGQASIEVRDHIQRCPYCASQARQFGRLDQRLQAGLYRTACPPASALARWQLHLLPTSEELQVAAHVRLCLHCTRELKELAAVDDDLLSALLERLTGVTRWLDATLRTATPVPAGMRGISAPQRRYKTPNLDIFVGSQVGSDGHRLMGRLRPPTGTQTAVEGIEILLVHQGQVLSSQTTDSRGHFYFSKLSPGQYDLGFGWQQQAVMIRDMEV